MTIPTSHQPWGPFEELTPTECLNLLHAKNIGRVAMCGPTGPQVFPVNYTMHDGCVLFRTAPYTLMARQLRDDRAAFEVDDIDDYLKCGWSVLVVGDAAHVEELPEEIAAGHAEGPEPWIGDDRPLYIRIRPIGITGRRVHPH